MLRKPSWLKVRLPAADTAMGVTRLMSDCRLHTVCQEARCPNLAECFQAGTATFLILGDCCTRNCGYCNVRTGIPQAVDEDEPKRLVSAVERLGLSYVVITSVTRDDLAEGGAGQFARCIRKIREVNPDCAVEVLIPDFNGSFPALRMASGSRPGRPESQYRGLPNAFPGSPAGRRLRSLPRSAAACPRTCPRHPY